MESKAPIRAHAACERAHSERTFEFLAEGPMSEVAPLFGAHKERLWAPGWDPCFIWPACAEDRPGMVFTVSGQHGTAVWINTRFEPARRPRAVRLRARERDEHADYAAHHATRRAHARRRFVPAHRAQAPGRCLGGAHG